MIRKNDRLTVTIEDYSTEGYGIAKANGYVLFVPGSVVGDTLDILVVKCNKNWGYGKLMNILHPSPARTDSLCLQSNKCGGCVFWQMNYQEELRLKSERVRQNLIRLGGIEHPDFPEIIGADALCQYRNKAQYPIRLLNGKAEAGFFAAGSHRVIPSDGCRIQPEIFDNILRFTLNYIHENQLPPYDEEHHTGLIRHLYLRHGKQSGEIMVCLVVTQPANFLPYKEALLTAFPEVKCVCVNINSHRTNAILGKQTEFLTERKYIIDTLLDKEFAISPHSFYQVNHDQTERLYSVVQKLADIRPEDTVLDLYCGIGTIGICVAGRAKKLVGVEIVPDAVQNARENARRNSLSNTEYFCADAKSGTQMLLRNGYHFDVVIVDPPRKGCDADTIEALHILAPSKLVYVSCDPATLARDIKKLIDCGFKFVSATPVDMFPRTAHVETVVLLTKTQN